MVEPDRTAGVTFWLTVNIMAWVVVISFIAINEWLKR